MRNRITCVSGWGLLLVALLGQGCANVIGGSESTEVVSGTPVIDRGDVQRTLVLSTRGNDVLEADSAPISEGVVFVSAVEIEPTTITTPQLQRSTREVIPYSGLGELAEWPFSTILGWIPLLEGTLGFGHYIDGVNPFMNSGFFTKRRETETLDETSIQPRVEERRHARRVEGARIALRFPGLPRVEMVSQGEDALVVPLDRLMTRPLASAPGAIEGTVAFEGAAKAVKVRAELAPELSGRVFRASRLLGGMDGSDPSDVAKTMLELASLGFPSRAEAVERSGVARHGQSVLGRAVADLHMEEARAAHARDDREAALEAIGLARARVARGPKAWDLIEADVHEAAGLRALEGKDYERARIEFLTASRLDSGRQTRLSSFIAIAIEAMDRKTALEERVGQGAVAPASAMNTAAPREAAAPNIVEQCLAREAALQACRLMPGFGKDLCKSGVRAKYSAVSCP